MALSFPRRRRGDFTMDDLADACHGQLIGNDNSDEPRLSTADATRMLAGSHTADETASVLAFVRAKDQRRVIAAAHRRRDRAEQDRLRDSWDDRRLPFGGDGS